MFMDNANFYPTPIELTRKMFDKVDLKKSKAYKKLRILEPSAGRGDLIEGFKQCWVEQQEALYKEMGWRSKDGFDADKKFKFDCIEIDHMLADILRGKGYNVIHNNFLTFDGNMYDLIFANFPFSEGVNHLLQAIRLQERVGGQIVCLLNAETLRNTYSNNRKQLDQLLQKYNADIEYIKNGFVDSERSTNVEVALITINVPMADNITMFEKEFNKENPTIQFEEFKAISVKKSKIEQLVDECNITKKSVSNLFLEKMKVENLLSGFNLKSGVKLCMNTTKDYKEIELDEYISQIDLDFWNKFIEETDLMSRLPSQLRDTFRNNMDIRRDIPFTLDNAFYFYEELMNSIPQSYEEMCSKLFDKLTLEYHYSEQDWVRSIHLFSGWKTNNAYKIGKRVIIPTRNYGYMYDLPTELTDLIIVFENLSGVRNTMTRYSRHGNDDTYNKVLEAMKNFEKNIDCYFFTLDVYKKGTVHIKFKDMALVEQFNLIVAKHKQWLPPSFGKKAWSDMDEEEQSAIKSFGIDVNSYALYSGKQDYLRLMA